MTAPTGGALDGIRLLDLSTQPGQYAGRLLADLGADTIKVEPPGGDAMRRVGPFEGDAVGPESSLTWRYFNANKRSVTCNLDLPGGQRLLRELARDADVVLESYGPGYMESRGVGFEALRAVRPDLVYVSISGFGREGPHAGWQATELIAQAASGVLTLSGDPAGAPQMLGASQACITASLSAAQGALLAVFHKERTGEGQLVEVSMQEALSIAQETAMQQWDFQRTSRERQGEIPTLPGLGTYATRDGYVYSMVGGPAGASWSELVDWLIEEGAGGELVAGHEAAFRALNMETAVQALRNPAKAAEFGALMPVARETLAAFFATRTSREIYEEGQRRRLLIGMVSTPRELMESPQLRARDWRLPVGGDGAAADLPGPPYRLSATPATVRRAAPAIGEHNREVWLEEVGIAPEEFEALAAEGAI
ncbi:MAG: CoA transferase [Chloroflexota bacterium]|nr:CoA transferase [Chloroflexota bacterium]